MTLMKEMMMELLWSNVDGQVHLSSTTPSPSCPHPRNNRALRIKILDTIDADIDNNNDN